MRFKVFKSPNYSIRQKSCPIKYIILHFTGMQSERESINRLTNKKNKVSAHYLINRKGDLIKIVEEKNIAWHAGKSRWKNIINLNSQSIGVELVNKGHRFGYENFSKKQINKLILLCRILIKKYKIKKTRILGHSDIAPLRKMDPGEKFPWELLAKKKIGYWYKASKKNNKSDDYTKEKLRNLFFSNLYKIGYRYFNKRKSSNLDIKLIKTFQRRFRQKKVDGKIDGECLQISHYLAQFLKN